MIGQMARKNPWRGEERIKNQLLLKLGLRVSARTVRKYLPKLPAAPAGKPRCDQRWSTFLKNHAQAIVACDFCVVASATFQLFYVLAVKEHAPPDLFTLTRPRIQPPPGPSSNCAKLTRLCPAAQRRSGPQRYSLQAAHLKVGRAFVLPGSTLHAPLESNLHR